jgi:F0F1-type ATP synthase assembly protein I
LQLGWMMAGAMLIPLGIGIWLDRRYSTAPLFILVGALVGVLASTIGVMRLATRMIETSAQMPRDAAEDDAAVHGKEE